MGSSLDETLRARRRDLEALKLHRSLRWLDSGAGTRVVWQGRELVNFASNDYLGLASHPELKRASIEAVEKFGAGTGASRLITGSLAPFRELEETIAKFKGTARALSFANGYAAAMGTIPSLVGPDDVVVIDRLSHASLVDAARDCGAKLRVFKHNDLEDLRAILKWTMPLRSAKASTRVLVVTESVFSMDGDRAPLKEMVALKDEFGAWLMVDEAHGTGVFGDRGRGWADAQGVSGRIEVQMGTLGKAVGAAGGFIAGSEALIDHLINNARTFIFSTAPVPASAAAATAGLRVIDSAEGDQLRAKLWDNIRSVWSALPEKHRSSAEPQSPIIPILLGEEEKALAAAAKLLEAGFLVPAIRYPTVARGAARLRVTVSAAHNHEEIGNFAGALAKLG